MGRAEGGAVPRFINILGGGGTVPCHRLGLPYLTLLSATPDSRKYGQLPMVLYMEYNILLHVKMISENACFWVLTWQVHEIGSIFVENVGGDAVMSRPVRGVQVLSTSKVRNSSRGSVHEL